VLTLSGVFRARRCACVAAPLICNFPVCKVLLIVRIPIVCPRTARHSLPGTFLPHMCWRCGHFRKPFPSDLCLLHLPKAPSLLPRLRQVRTAPPASHRMPYLKHPPVSLSADQIDPVTVPLTPRPRTPFFVSRSTDIFRFFAVFLPPAEAGPWLPWRFDQPARHKLLASIWSSAPGAFFGRLKSVVNGRPFALSLIVDMLSPWLFQRAGRGGGTALLHSLHELLLCIASCATFPLRGDRTRMALFFLFFPRADLFEPAPLFVCQRSICPSPALLHSSLRILSAYTLLASTHLIFSLPATLWTRQF